MGETEQGTKRITGETENEREREDERQQKKENEKKNNDRMNGERERKRGVDLGFHNLASMTECFWGTPCFGTLVSQFHQ